MITQSRLKELFHYNPETGEFTRLVRRGSRGYIGTVAGGDHGDGYRFIKIDSKQHLIHRLVFLYVNGEFPTGEVDHINGVKGDNRLENLRIATRSQNTQNTKTCRSNSSTKLLGVSTAKNRFRATIVLNKKWHFIGNFDTPEEAHQAYLKKKREIHEFCTI